MTEFIPHVINGEETGSVSGARFATVDPWVRQPWAEVAQGGPDDAGRAVAAARLAFDEGPWPRMELEERGALLRGLADLIIANAADLAMADTTDMGKPIMEGLENDVPHAALTFRFFADHARLATADVLPVDAGHHAYTRFDPAGVVAAITPWNFPLMLAAWKVAPALAWGNTVVLKPAEESPASAAMLARLALEAGIPPGVLNVVQGDGPAVGGALTSDPRVNRIAFAGDADTGRAVAAAAAANLTPVNADLGGNGASVVFADADLRSAVDWSVRAIFSNSGQVCLAGSRLFVQRPVYSEFVDRLRAAAEELRIGDPKVPDTEFGPQASEEHYLKVRSYLAAIGPQGGTIVTGGLGDRPWVVRPTIVAGAPPDAPISAEEICGPVAVVHPFDTEEQAVTAANGTRYGLNAIVFTENLSRAHRVSAALRAGTVWANCFSVRDLRAPFGGAGDSGVGRGGGTFSRDFFTEPKAVVMAIKPS